jgi:hypothetical protein
MRTSLFHPHVDGEELARAARNRQDFATLVRRLRRDGASAQALARAKTVISALRVRR